MVDNKQREEEITEKGNEVDEIKNCLHGFYFKELRVSLQGV